MKNLLKSDFYRLFKSLSFYICTAVSVVLFGSAIFLLKMSFKLLASQGMNEPFPYKDGLSYGLTAFTDGSLQIILAVFIAIFVTAEFSHGTMKNAVSKGFSKLEIYMSKLIVMSCAAFIMLLVTISVSTLTGTMVTGSFCGYLKDYIGDLLNTTGIELLLYIALSAVLVMLANTVRNLGGVIAIAIVGVIMMEPKLFNLLEFVAKSKIEFSKFSLIYNIMSYAGITGIAVSDYIRSVVVGIAFLAVTAAFGIFMFKRSDIK